MIKLFILMLFTTIHLRADFSGHCGYPIPEDSSNYCGMWIKPPIVIDTFVECFDKEKEYYCKGFSKEEFEAIQGKCSIESIAYMGSAGIDKGELSSATSMLILSCLIQNLKNKEFYDCGCDL